MNQVEPSIILCRGQQTDFATFLCFILQEGQGEITTFVYGDFRVVWYTRNDTHGDIIADGFDVFFKISKLDATEELLLTGIVPESVLRRLASAIAPGLAPEEILGIVS
jgi:hypothetical protein